MSTVGASWGVIERWLLASAPPLHAALRPGADPRTIARAESALGVSLPAPLRESLGIHDGVATNFCFVHTWVPLSVAGMLREWQTWCDVANRMRAGRAPAASRGVKPLVWSPKWIPISSSGSGDSDCVDLDPGEGGSSGQVLRIFHDIPERVADWKSYEEWLSSFAADLERGRYRFSEREGGLYE